MFYGTMPLIINKSYLRQSSVNVIIVECWLDLIKVDCPSHKFVKALKIFLRGSKHTVIDTCSCCCFEIVIRFVVYLGSGPENIPHI